MRLRSVLIVTLLATASYGQVPTDTFPQVQIKDPAALAEQDDAGDRIGPQADAAPPRDPQGALIPLEHGDDLPLPEPPDGYETYPATDNVYDGGDPYARSPYGNDRSGESERHSDRHHHPPR